MWVGGQDSNLYQEWDFYSHLYVKLAPGLLSPEDKGLDCLSDQLSGF
jgi:hypothetical protein